MTLRLVSVTEHPSTVEITPAIRARLELIRAALELPTEEIEAAIASDDAMLEFCRRYQQSLDYVYLGDIKGMIAACASYDARATAAYDAGYNDGARRRPHRCPAGLDTLAYASGYVEGKANPSEVH